MFVAKDFVLKHIKGKHSAKLAEARQQVSWTCLVLADFKRCNGVASALSQACLLANISSLLSMLAWPVLGSLVGPAVPVVGQVVGQPVLCLP